MARRWTRVASREEATAETELPQKIKHHSWTTSEYCLCHNFRSGWLFHVWIECLYLDYPALQGLSREARLEMVR